jgi:hypothetical protein
MTDTLSRDEHHLLDWLAKEDSSVVGECRGPALSELVARGFAVLVSTDVRGADYGRVALTDKGRALLRNLGPWEPGE